MSGDKMLLLPKLKKANFEVPKYIQVDEWIRSQGKYYYKSTFNY